MERCLFCGVPLENVRVVQAAGLSMDFILPGPHMAPCGLHCGAGAADRADGDLEQVHGRPGGCRICGQIQPDKYRRRQEAT